MMRCSVVIALVVLCQTCCLCVGKGPQELEDVTTTTQKVENTSTQNNGRQRARTTVVDPRLEDGRVPTRADQLVVSLNKFRAASVIPIWVYVLYAFGTPVAITIITVCMHFFAPEDVPGVWKPHLTRSMCFFDDPTRLFLYFYGPIGFLFALNIAFIINTYWTCRKVENQITELKGNVSENTDEIPKEHIRRKRDYISNFKQQFSLLVVMSLCWVTEILSWLIPPPEMWALTDTVNTLQGFFVFVIFIANRGKHKHLKKKFPLVFKFWNQIRKVFRHCCCWCCPDAKETCLAPLSSLTSQVSKKLSSSSIQSSLLTLSSLKFSKFSLSIANQGDLDSQSPSALEHDGGITISHSPEADCSVFNHEKTDTQC
ncbi:putative G-protein coupled receptor Mth-like 1 [Portunus trituberculatus]|uniref:Putative G-protein coupled receptor Mth-like 1 n=1 Tax=Portunus trituberculatus TaxID=210409 RepID=A0A5B7D8J2_PORTR|nr:putative G-protein coupled receptor Mth-like 1 [Portunus trituberculatus]